MVEPALVPNFLEALKLIFQSCLPGFHRLREELVLLTSPSRATFSPPTRADLLALREGAAEPPRAPALLLPAAHLVGARPGPGVAALRPERTFAGALPAHVAGRSPAPRVSSSHRFSFSWLTFLEQAYAFLWINSDVVILSCLEPSTKTGLFFWMRRRRVCSPLWPQVRIFAV